VDSCAPEWYSLAAIDRVRSADNEALHQSQRVFDDVMTPRQCAVTSSLNPPKSDRWVAAAIAGQHLGLAYGQDLNLQRSVGGQKIENVSGRFCCRVTPNNEIDFTRMDPLFKT
jgi:hypothetical protein